MSYVHSIANTQSKSHPLSTLCNRGTLGWGPWEPASATCRNCKAWSHWLAFSQPAMVALPARNLETLPWDHVLQATQETVWDDVKWCLHIITGTYVFAYVVSSCYNKTILASSLISYIYKLKSSTPKREFNHLRGIQHFVAQVTGDHVGFYGLCCRVFVGPRNKSQRWKHAVQIVVVVLIPEIQRKETREHP